jgi:type III pantothenate kinase
MFLAVDIGNSNIVLALYKYNQWSNIFRYETKEDQPIAFYEKGILNLFVEWGVRSSDIRIAGVSSVVPDLNVKIISALNNVIGQEVILINADTFSAIDMHVPRPYEIGTDLVANAYAAIKKYSTNSIIIDFGTALTFTVVNLSEGIKGVTIAPGLKTALLSLYGNTAQLPLVDFQIPKSAIGQNTSHAIQAGIAIGYKGLIKEIISSMQSELNDDSYKIIATGGLSGFIDSIDDIVDIHDRNLTLDGVKLMVEKQISLL